jgi:uncharacterized protein
LLQGQTSCLPGTRTVREYAHALAPNWKEGSRSDFAETVYWNAGVRGISRYSGYNMDNQAHSASIGRFTNQKAISLRTRKRDGTWVATPVNIAVEGDHAYVRTWKGSGKSKRLRNFADVQIAPSTLRGRETGPYVYGKAQLLTGEEARHAAALLARKHPVLHGVIVPFVHRLKRQTTEHYRIVLTPESGLAR